MRRIGSTLAGWFFLFMHRHGGTPPPATGFITTESGIRITTESGTFITTE